MDEEEIERLIWDLRRMMIDSGFGWAAEQAVECLGPEVTNIQVAKALVDSAARVTVDMADFEIQAGKALRVDEVRFKVDDADNGGELDSEVGTLERRSSAFEQADEPQGQQRIAMLEGLALYRTVFDQLKGLLGGDGD